MPLHCFKYFYQKENEVTNLWLACSLTPKSLTSSYQGNNALRDVFLNTLMMCFPVFPFKWRVRPEFTPCPNLFDNCIWNLNSSHSPFFPLLKKQRTHQLFVFVLWVSLMFPVGKISNYVAHPLKSNSWEINVNFLEITYK